MSWRQYVRDLERAENARIRYWRRRERDAVRNYRAMVREQREHAKHVERVQATDEALQFERYVELLVSLHKECSDPWDWAGLTVADPPAAPIRSDLQERAARTLRDSYAPGLIDRMFGAARQRRAELEQVVERASRVDETLYQHAIESYQRDHSAWVNCRTVGTRIVAGDVRAYGEALNLAGAFDELASFQTRVEIVGVRADALALTCRINDDELIPTEEVSVTAKGKLSSKEMAKGRYWALYQDHVCSAAIRVGREALAVLPIERVVVNIGPVRTNPATGHPEQVAYLAVQFTHEALGRLNLDRIDPSDSMTNFPHSMRFKKTNGFEPVAVMTLDDNWVTSG